MDEPTDTPTAQVDQTGDAQRDLLVEAQAALRQAKARYGFAPDAGLES